MITASTAASTVLAASPLAQLAGPGPQQWQGGGGPACFLIGLLVLGLLALAVVWFFRRRSGFRGGSGGKGPANRGASGGAASESGASGGGADRPSAEDILAERYAKGEMSDDEYLQRQSVLRGDGRQ